MLNPIAFAETCSVKHLKLAVFFEIFVFHFSPNLTGGMVGFGNPNFENAPPRKDDDSVGTPEDFWLGACLNEHNRKGRCFFWPQDLGDVEIAAFVS